MSENIMQTARYLAETVRAADVSIELAERVRALPTTRPLEVRIRHLFEAALILLDDVATEARRALTTTGLIDHAEIAKIISRRTKREKSPEEKAEENKNQPQQRAAKRKKSKGENTK